MKSRWHLVTVWALSVSSLVEGAEIGFKPLLQQLHRQSPSVKQAALPKEIAALEAKAAKWQLAPELSYRSSKSWLRDQDGDGWPPNRDTNIFELSWTVFDGLTGLEDINMSRLNNERAKLQELSDRADNYSTLAQAYLDWQLAVARMGILRELVGLRQKNVEKVRRRVRTGELERSESLLFENQLLEAEDRLLQATSQRDIAVAAIGALLPKHRLDPTKNTPGQKPLFTQDFCQQAETAVEQHPTIKALRLAISIASSRKNKSQGSLYPTAKVGAEQHMHAWGDPNSGPNQTFLTASLSWNLGEMLTSRYDRQITSLQLQDARLAAEAATIALRHRIASNCQRLGHLQRRLGNSVGLVSNYERLYAQGERKFSRAGLSSLDLIRLQQDLLTSRLQAVQLRHDQQQLRMQQTLVFDPLKFSTAY